MVTMKNNLSVRNRLDNDINYFQICVYTVSPLFFEKKGASGKI